MVELFREGESDMLGNVFSLFLLVTFNADFVESEDVGLLASGPPQLKPVLHGVETLCLSVLRHLSALHPALAVLRKLGQVFLQFALSALRVTTWLNFVERKGSEWLLLVNPSRFFLSQSLFGV